MDTGIVVGSAATGRASTSTSVDTATAIAIIGVTIATTKVGLNRRHGPILAIGPLAFKVLNASTGVACQARDRRDPLALGLSSSTARATGAAPLTSSQRMVPVEPAPGMGGPCAMPAGLTRAVPGCPSLVASARDVGAAGPCSRRRLAKAWQAVEAVEGRR